MDLRVKRTQKNIREAFFRLRKKKNLDKISVKELSEKAMINKATFYLHYKDVYDLSEKLENELIASMIDEVRSYDLRKGRSEFRGFAEKLSKTIIENSSEIKTLFSFALSRIYRTITRSISPSRFLFREPTIRISATISLLPMCASASPLTFL